MSNEVKTNQEFPLYAIALLLQRTESIPGGHSTTSRVIATYAGGLKKEKDTAVGEAIVKAMRENRSFGIIDHAALPLREEDIFTLALHHPGIKNLANRLRDLIGVMEMVKPTPTLNCVLGPEGLKELWGEDLTKAKEAIELFKQYENRTK